MPEMSRALAVALFISMETSATVCQSSPAVQSNSSCCACKLSSSIAMQPLLSLAAYTLAPQREYGTTLVYLGRPAHLQSCTGERAGRNSCKYTAMTLLR